MSEEAVRAAFAEQAMWCERLGSPFTAMLCRLTSERIDRDTAIGRLVLDWSGDPSPGADNLPARFCAGLHSLALSGAVPDLSRLYPPGQVTDQDRLWTAIVQALDAESPSLGQWIASPPQTNEVARSSALMSGLLVVADLFGLPLRLLELGSSAGLNLILDRYDHDLGGLRAGTAGSPVRLAPRWKGGRPPEAEVRIIDRRGVDLRPVDVHREGHKLIAFVWADQLERRERLEAAIALASADPPKVDAGDAADWLEAILSQPPEPASARVVMHSIAYQYFPEGTKARVDALMNAAGGSATADTPLAWLRYEQQDGEERPSLRLKTWPAGEDRLLAWCHGHGASVDWVATS